MLRKFALLFCIGVIARLFTPVVGESSLMLLAFVPVLLFMTPSLRRFGWLGIALPAGAAYAQIAISDWIGEQQLINPDGRQAWVEVEIDTPARAFIGRVRIEARLNRVDGKPVSGRIRLDCASCPLDFQPGQTWRLRVSLKPIHGLVNPGGFDYERWAVSRDLIARGSVKIRGQNEVLSPGQGQPFRIRFFRHLQEFYSDSPVLGILQGILLGIRHNITARQWAVFSATGTGHLVAISGLHIGLAFFCFYWLAALSIRCVPPLLLYVPAQKLAALIALPPTVFFAINAGFSLPTQRALIMLAVFYLSFVLGRKPPVWHNFSVAMMLVLIFDPFAPLGSGFWLSFGAVGAILFYLGGNTPLSPDVNSHEVRRNRLAMVTHKLRGWIGIQLTVSAVMLPLGYIFFASLPWLSPFINLLAIPIFSAFVLPPALASMFLWQAGFDGLAAVLMQLAAFCLEHMQAALSFVAAWSVPRGQVPAVFQFSVAMAVGGLWLGWKYKKVSFLLLPLLVLFPWLLQPRLLASGEFEIAVLDVAQGLAIGISTASGVTVFDTGTRFGSGYDMGKLVVTPWLESRGAGEIEELIISHGDRDHIGGFAAVTGRFNTNRVYASETGNPSGARPCVRGESWHRDGVSFKFLWPESVSATRHNNRSCVLRISSRYGSALLPGDIERETEFELGRRYPNDLKSNLLIIPHHGSKTSSSAGFLDLVSAHTTVVSRGYLNPFGHPHATVLERLLRHGGNLHDTALHGAVIYRQSAGGVETITWRQRYAGFWRRFGSPK